MREQCIRWAAFNFWKLTNVNEKYIQNQIKMVQLTCAVIVCLSLFGKIVNAKPGYASGYDVDYYVRQIGEKWGLLTSKDFGFNRMESNRRRSWSFYLLFDRNSSVITAPDSQEIIFFSNFKECHIEISEINQFTSIMGDTFSACPRTHSSLKTAASRIAILLPHITASVPLLRTARAPSLNINLDFWMLAIYCVRSEFNRWWIRACLIVQHRWSHYLFNCSLCRSSTLIWKLKSNAVRVFSPSSIRN